MNNIKTGDIIFFHPDKTFTGKIIKFCTTSDLSHVGIAYWLNNELYILESQYLKDRRMVSIDFYNGRKIEVVSSGLSNVDDLLTTLGKINYGYKDLILAGIKGLLLKIGISVKFKNHEGEICSEMVAKFMKYEPSNISPIELYVKLLNDGHYVKYSRY